MLSFAQPTSPHLRFARGKKLFFPLATYRGFSDELISLSAAHRQVLRLVVAQFIARLGEGTIHETKYSLDGTRIAVAGGIGIWIYDTATYQESACSPGIRLGSIALHSVRMSAQSLVVGVGGSVASACGAPTRAHTLRYRSAGR